MDLTYDIAVVGGGMPGVCAAISAAETGSNVILFCDRPVLGGNASSECCVPPHGAEALGHNRNLRDTGILENLRLDFFCGCSKHSDVVSYGDVLLMDRCRETKNLTVMLNTRVFEVLKDDSKITSLKVLNLNSNEIFSVNASIIIDDTGDGTIGYLAGAEFRKGREDKREFSENILGHEKADDFTLGCSIYGWATRRDFPVSFTPPEWAVKYPDCDSLSHRAHDIDSIIPRVTISEDHGQLMFFWWIEWGGELDVINDLDKIYDHLLAELFGLWDHLKNHCNEKTRNALANYELTNWSKFPMKRESRRLVGDYILNENDVIHGRIFDDEIGYGGWPMDDHPPMGIASKEPSCNQLFFTKPYSVPLRCCYSKNITNLFMVGRCISVTHAALSTVRVMNTLSSIAESVGVAASLCCRKKISPRELCLSYIDELHKIILKRDLFLIGKKGLTDGDLACSAVPAVSSEKTYSSVTDSVGEFKLVYDSAIRLPVSSENISGFSLKLNGSEKTRISWKMYFGQSINDFECTEIASGYADVPEGKNDVELLTSPVALTSKGILTLVLFKNDKVSWGYGDELYGSRWGVDFHGEMQGLNYHGASYIVSPDTSWLWINGNCRLPAELTLWIRGLVGKKRHDKLFITPAFRIKPEQKPYGADNLINGIARTYDMPNIWCSSDPLPQTAELNWKEPVNVSSVEVIFDTDLDCSDLRYGFPRCNDDNIIPETIEKTVSGYRILLYGKNGLLCEKEFTGNHYRRNIISFDNIIKDVSKLELIVTKTLGSKDARVFEIRVF